MNIKSLKECKVLLMQIGDYLRHNDKYIKDIDIEERTFLNDVGKVIGWIWKEMMAYNYANGEKKLEIRQRIHMLNLNKNNKMKTNEQKLNLDMPAGEIIKYSIQLMKNTLSDMRNAIVSKKKIRN